MKIYLKLEYLKNWNEIVAANLSDNVSSNYLQEKNFC